jgi:branched-chain amino acid transport system ATP-binding protein
MLISSSDTLLKVENLCTGYGKRQVLFDVSFEVKRGEVVLLIGGNGSGKSTVLKAVYGLLNDYRNREGSICFDGENITNSKPSQMLGRGLIYVPQKNNTFDQLSLMENLQVAASSLINEDEKRRRINKVFEMLPQLAKLEKKTPFQLSGGEKQLLALGMALTLQPKMIMLDEPNAGLAPNAWQKNLETIGSLNQQGITFLIVEHWVKEAIGTAHSVLRMKLGKLENATKEGLVNYEK